VKWDEGTTTKSCHKDLEPIDVANDLPSGNADIIVDAGLDQHLTADSEVLTDEVVSIARFFFRLFIASLFSLPAASQPPLSPHVFPVIVVHDKKMVTMRPNFWEEKKI
jgi:hypothetical protein